MNVSRAPLGDRAPITNPRGWRRLVAGEASPINMPVPQRLSPSHLILCFLLCVTLVAPGSERRRGIPSIWNRVPVVVVGQRSVTYRSRAYMAGKRPPPLELCKAVNDLEKIVLREPRGCSAEVRLLSLSRFFSLFRCAFIACLWNRSRYVYHFALFECKFHPLLHCFLGFYRPSSSTFPPFSAPILLSVCICVYCLFVEAISICE